jgi:single-stranded DNA-binding protein
MPYLNNVKMIGRFADAASINSNGTAAHTRLALNRPAGKGQSEADFFNLVFFGDRMVESVRRVGKGDLVLVEGRLRNRSFPVGQGDEQRRFYVTEIVVTNIQYLKRNGKTQAEA